MLEKDIEMYFKKRIEYAGGLCLKFSSPGCTGVPDRIVVYGGKVTFVEFKAPGRDVSKRQAIMIERIRACGCRVYVVWDLETADLILGSIFEGSA